MESDSESISCCLLHLEWKWDGSVPVIPLEDAGLENEEDTQRLVGDVYIGQVKIIIIIITIVILLVKTITNSIRYVSVSSFLCICGLTHE
jgi:hypothetical protein